MSNPISATRLRAATRTTPGTLIQRATASASSWRRWPRCSTRASSARISASRKRELTEQAIQKKSMVISGSRGILLRIGLPFLTPHRVIIMKVLVLGGTGATGREVVGQALEQGHCVSVLVRHPEKLGRTEGTIRVLTGDVSDGGPALALAMTDQEAVISTLGVGKSLKSRPGLDDRLSGDAYQWTEDRQVSGGRVPSASRFSHCVSRRRGSLPRTPIERCVVQPKGCDRRFLSSTRRNRRLFANKPSCQVLP